MSSKFSKSVYRFLELGRGLVDVPAVFESLVKLVRGWAVIELDEVPENAHSPKKPPRLTGIPQKAGAEGMNSPFRISVINDEVARTLAALAKSYLASLAWNG